MAEGFTNVAGQRLDVPDPTVAMSGQMMGGSSFKIVGSTLQAAILTMRNGAQIYTETGALSWMSDGINMNTNMGGGIGGLFKRALGGESLFVVDYTAQRDGALAAFSSDFPGKILPINLAQGQTMIAQRQSFLVAEKTVNLSIQFNRKLGSGLFGGEGLFCKSLMAQVRFLWRLTVRLWNTRSKPGRCSKSIPVTSPCLNPAWDLTSRWSKALRTFCLVAKGCFLPSSLALAECGYKPCP